MILCNQENQPFRIKTDDVIGCLNMKSTHYYHVTADYMERNLKDQCIFLTEDKTCAYSNSILGNSRIQAGDSQTPEWDTDS